MAAPTVGAGGRRTPHVRQFARAVRGRGADLGPAAASTHLASRLSAVACPWNFAGRGGMVSQRSTATTPSWLSAGWSFLDRRSWRSFELEDRTRETDRAPHYRVVSKINTQKWMQRRNFARSALYFCTQAPLNSHIPP